MQGLRQLVFLFWRPAKTNAVYSQRSQSFTCATLDVPKAWVLNDATLHILGLPIVSLTTFFLTIAFAREE
jgi:hypothetical protein